ncbi:MAG: SDR family oxidoreductase [Sphingobium sp.]
MFLITAANGNQGKLLMPKLAAAGLPVRALVRTEQSGEKLRGLAGVEVMVGDMADPGVLDRAMAGVTSVYHIGPVLHPKEREIGFAAIDAAKAAGVRHFVFSSVLHAIITDLVQHEIKRDVEEHLLSSDLEFTILQPANYMLPLKLEPVFRDGVFRLSWSLDRLQSVVDLDDVTDVVVEVLTHGERHYGATYELVGRGRYDAHHLGRIISQVVGRDIPVEEIDGDEYLKAFIGDRDPAGFTHEARVLRAITARYSAHDFIGNPNVLGWLLGREPTSYAQFVEREFRHYQARAAQTAEA